MKQLRFFEITKDDWDFLLLYKEAKKEYKGWVEAHESYLDLESEFIKHLDDNNLLLRNNIIDIKDIRMKKRLSDNLKMVQKELQWIPNQIEDIKLWLEYNSERAANIN